MEGKEGACQGVAHELAHLRQFQRDRRRLHQYFSNHPVPEDGWKGCERETLAKPSASQAEEEAYLCLQDNDLITHAASMDIEAVLAQIPYARQKKLRDDDLLYLVENLTHWSEHSNQVTMQANESYYRPEIKREDIHVFCQGVDAARSRWADTAASRYGWQTFCRVSP